MDNRIVTLPLRVEPFTEDFLGRISWGVLGNLLLRISEIHATANGFGYEGLTKAHKAWVLSRMTIMMNHRPKTYEVFELATWVINSFRQFSTRNYSLKNASGDFIGYGTSTWAMIDTETRTACNIAQFDTEGIFEQGTIPEAVPIAEPERMRIKATEPLMSYTTAYSDLDINGHVNSIRYLQLLLNLFPKEQYQESDLKRIDLAYIKESYSGDTLHFYLEEQATGKYVAQINNNANEPIVKALLYFC